MMLKVGELAKRTGLTVRTLHHYDELGLLSPSARSDTGYRLYNKDDIVRLHRILALRQLGLPLSDIGHSLANDGLPLPELIQRQLHVLDDQIAEAVLLRNRLERLQATLRQQAEPEFADWLNTLEMMTVYDKYFTAEEQAELASRRNDPNVAQVQAAWPALVAEVRQLMSDGVPPADPVVRAAAARWSDLVQQFTQGSANLLIKTAKMKLQEESLHVQSGIDPAMMAYVAESLAVTKLEIYARYLNEDEMVRMRAHYGKAPDEWVPLIAEARALMQGGTPPEHPDVRAMAARWQALTNRFAGTDPATRQKLRQAMEAEPVLLVNTGIDFTLLQYVQAAGRVND